MDFLYSTNQKDAKLEAELRQWLRDNFGEQDAKTLISWVWDNHKNGVGFVEALASICAETELNGRKFVHNLLEVAQKPKLVRDAEMEIFAWAKPRIEEATAKIRACGGDPQAKRAEMDAFVFALEDKLYNMWPGKHRATMKGAILTAFKDLGGRLEFNTGLLVQTLNMEDPLAATASTSGRR